MKLRRVATEAPHAQCTDAALKQVGVAAAVIGNKWTPLILFALVDGPRRFSELRAAAGGPNPRTFSARLEVLEREGIVGKKSYAELPPRVEYSLTPKGEALVPIFEQMRTWGEKYACPTGD